MGKRRGFFAELQHQNQIAAKQRERQAKAAAQAHASALRQAEQAQRAAARARANAAKMTATARKQAEAEAKRLHIEAREAEAASMNAELLNAYDNIDSILNATLEVDDFVDLEELRVVVEQPPFPSTELEQQTAAPTPIAVPAEPTYTEPQQPTGLSKIFGGASRHAKAVAAAQTQFTLDHDSWKAYTTQIPRMQLEQMQTHQAEEQERTRLLTEARAKYDTECMERQAKADTANAELDEFLEALDRHDEEAVQEYVSIVLGNSVYPEDFPIDHEFQFNSDLRELTLEVTISGPETVPTIKAFKYSKSSDEITQSSLPAKEVKERYANAVNQVAIRTLHEVFEADRAGRIQTISLTVCARALDPATGTQQRIALVAVASDRETFDQFDLANIVPSATLTHLNAVVSKNPHGLVAIDESAGVRGK